jgi:hypothetical protein
MDTTRLGRAAPVALRLAFGVALAAIGLLPHAAPSRAAPPGQGEGDRNIVVQVNSPRPGERVRGRVMITGYAADRRSADGSGLNERDIQVWLNDASDSRNQLGFAGGGRPSPDAAALLGPQFDRVGFERVWDTCSLSPGPYELIVWVSSLIVPGSRNSASVDVEVEACPAEPTPQPPTPTVEPPRPTPPTEPPPPAPTAEPPPAAAPGGPGRILLRDDFSDPNSGWNQGSDPANWRLSYEGGEYVAIKMAGSYGAWVMGGHTRGSFRDFQIEVDARLAEATPGAYLFVAFRSQDLNNWYSFAVNPINRLFGLYRGVSGNSTPIITERSAPAINGGTARNRLAVRARGPEIVLLVNGQEVGRTRDDTRLEGSFGLGAGSTSGGRSEARFSNLIVTSVD